MAKLGFNDFVSQPLDGRWGLFYRDASHIPQSPELKVRIGDVTVTQQIEEGDETRILPFSFNLINQADLINSFRSCWKDKNDQALKIEIYPQRVFQEISESLIRTRVVTPEISRADWMTLINTSSVIILSDTNCVKRGVISYLVNVMEGKPIWVVVPVISMIEFQEASVRGKFIPNRDSAKPNNSLYLNNRPMNTSSSRELLNLKKLVPVEFLETPPELLKYYSSSRLESEEDKEFLLKDRIIIETAKIYLRNKNFSGQAFFLSGDVDIVRYAKLENINSIYAGKRILRGGESFYSIRYDLFKKCFTGCGIHEFIWDLTHVFSEIILTNDAGKVITLKYYFEGKNVQDWENDILEVEVE